MASIVVLGAGIGGMSVAYELRALLGKDHPVTVVGEGEQFSFTPSNPWVAVGWRARREIEVALPPVMAKKGIGFTGVGAKRVHPTGNRIELNDGSSVDYDYLVIATGASTNFFGNKNLEQHAFPMKSTVEALQLRHKLIQNFEDALHSNSADELEKLMNIVVVLPMAND